MNINIPYTPHAKQEEIHADSTRFRVVAAGRRWGKTVFAINELIRAALSNPAQANKPVQRSWYVCETYRQAEMIAWRTCLKYLPDALIKAKNVNKLSIELINGHIIEFKGSEDPDKLRGVPLVFVILDEYGNMKPEVFTEVIRASLLDAKGRALFIGTPGADGSPHFHDIFRLGQGKAEDYKSWLFYTKDNPHIDQGEIAKAKKELPRDIYKREFEADFTSTSGLIYDNFSNSTHVIPHYEPGPEDFVVGSIDPGLHNPTGAILTAWDKDGYGRVFKEYYEEGRLAGENGVKLAELAKDYRVAYWVIDRSSIRRDPTSGISVFSKFIEHLKPLITAPNDPGSVWAGIDEVKKLFHVGEGGRPKLQICVQNYWTLWELARYTRYKRKWHSEKNEEERPRKLNDHLMDCIRNMVLTRPWMRRDIRLLSTARKTGY